MKELIITASTYLSNLLSTYIRNSNDTIDLLVNKSIIGKDINVDYAKIAYSGKIRQIYEAILPIDYCYRGRQLSKWFDIKIGIKSLIYPIGQKNIFKIIQNGDYDFIYLNNLILHNLISSDYPTIIHIRELYNEKNPKVIENIQKAYGVIFIDTYVKEPFKNISLKNSIVLNNPFDMKKSNKNINSILDLEKLQISENDTLFAVIGKIEPEKGISFIIQSFKKMNDIKSKLLIIGNGEKKYIEYCKTIANDDSRIIFIDAIEDIQIIYDCVDYVVRGEITQSGGRTMYEGLYSGCGVIVPGNNPSEFFNYEKFKDQIHIYTPGSDIELAKQFEKLNNTKINEREYISNVGEYMSDFNNFIKTVLIKYYGDK